MNLRYWIDRRINQIRPTAVREYLLDHGWTNRPYPGPDLMVFEKNGSDRSPITLVLPTSEKMADYINRLLTVVNAICVLEDRHVEEVIPDLLKLNPPESSPAAMAPKNNAVQALPS